MQYRNNPLAPPWMWSGSYCSPAGAVDSYFVYVVRQALVSGQSVNNQAFPFDGDGCFVWRVAASAAGQASIPYMAWRDSEGRQLSNQLLGIPGWCGGAGEHTPVLPTVTVDPGARWTYTVVDTGNVGSGFAHFALIGVKRRGA
jgi:hypothetical protein